MAPHFDPKFKKLDACAEEEPHWLLSCGGPASLGRGDAWRRMRRGAPPTPPTPPDGKSPFSAPAASAAGAAAAAAAVRRRELGFTGELVLIYLRHSNDFPTGNLKSFLRALYLFSVAQNF